MAMSTAARYRGKPLLRLLECYVLKSMGELTAADEAKMQELQPRLAKLYGHPGDWDEILAATLEFPPEFPEMISEMWEDHLEMARTSHATLGAQEFAEMFVDENLVE